MARRKPTKRKIIQRPVEVNCYFCNSDRTPNYKNYDELTKFLSDRSKILGKKRTGICSKHQRLLGVAIKRARFLGLLPYAPKV
jgi:small subunit ribosomal protein S18